MKTTTYGDIKNLAAELTGRTRDNLPTQEAAMLLAFAAVELPTLWNLQCWPELNPAPLQVSVTSRLFSKNEGEEDEIGDVLGVFAANPGTTTRARAVGFSEIDGSVRIDESLGTVYVDYMLPAPDLLEVESDELAEYEIPARFKMILAYLMAENLLRADGDLAGAGVFHGLAEARLNSEINRLPPAPWWRGVSKRKDYNGSVSSPLAVES
jgi:hypothetical protein